MNKFYIAGIGPGSMDYVLPITKKLIKTADLLIGSERVLSLFQNKENIKLEFPYDKIIKFIRRKIKTKKIVVLVSGDPGIYSFLAQIQKHFKKDEYVVIPGISSLQVAFARIGEMWQDAEIISLHGRKTAGLAKTIKDAKKTFLFTDNKFPPDRIASYLLCKGLKNRNVFIFENLAYPEENITATNLKNLSEMKGFGQCVMIIIK